MRTLLIFAAFSCIALSACQPSDNDKIRIGYIGPLTGDAAPFGIDTLNGTKLAIKEINAKGGINGKTVELIAEDARCTGADAASAAQKLISIDKVIAIIGGQCSGETLAAAPIAEAAKVVMISPVSSSPDVTLAGDFIFRDYPSDALKTKALTAFLRDEKFERMAIISENTDFAQAFRQSLIVDFGKDNIVFDEIVEPGTKDFRTLVSRLKDLEFDIFFPNAQTDAVMAAMMQQLREQGLSQQAISHDVADSVTLGELAPDAVEGMYVVNVPTSGEGSGFEQTFKEQFGSVQSTIAFAAHAYDAMNVLAGAISAAGTDGTSIRDALYNLPSHSGVVGTFSFDENGDVVGLSYSLKAFKNGAIMKVKDIAAK